MRRWSCDGFGRAAGALALAGGLVLASVAAAAAQATPEAGIVASPAAGPCEAPAAMADMTGMAATPMGDAAAEVATPVGTPAAEGEAADAVAAVENYVNCWNAGEVSTALALLTPNLLQTSFGVPDAATAEAALAGIDVPVPYTILETGNAQIYDNGRVSIDVVYLLGDHQYTNARWYLVMAGDQFLLDEEQLLRPQPEGDTALLSFSIADDASPVVFDGAASTPALPVVLLYGANNGAERHFFQVFRIPEAMAATPVAAGELMMAGEFVGMLALGPGQRQELALVNLPPGSYVLVDPAVEGSAATLTVTEPEPAA